MPDQEPEPRDEEPRRVSAIPYALVVVAFVVVFDQFLFRNLGLETGHVIFYTFIGASSFFVIGILCKTSNERWIGVSICVFLALFYLCLTPRL